MLRTTTLFLSIVFFLICRSVVAQDTQLLTPSAVDSIRILLSKSKPDTTRVNLLLELGENFNNYSATDSAFFYGSKAEKLSKNLGYNKGLIRSRYLVGSILYLTESTRKTGKDLLLRTLELSKKLGYKDLEGKGWTCLTITHDWNAQGLTGKMQCLEKALTCFKKAGNKKEIATSFMTLAFLSEAIPDINLAVKYYLQVLNYTNNNLERANALQHLANHRLAQGKSAIAVSELMQALTIYQSLNYYKLYPTYDLLAESYRDIGNYQEAVKYSLKAAENAKKIKDFNALGYMYSRTSSIYNNLDQHKEALLFSKKALEIYKAKKEIIFIYNTVAVIADILQKQGKSEEGLSLIKDISNRFPTQDNKILKFHNKALAISYEGLTKYKLAGHYYDKLIEQELKGSPKTVLLNTYLRCIAFNIKIKNYNKASNYLSKSKSLNEEFGTVYNKLTFYLLASKIDSAKGNYQQALINFQQYKALNDSIFNESKNKQIAILQIQYDTKEKEQRIRLLRKQTQVQQASILQKEMQRNTFIIGVLVLLIITGLICNRYRLKEKSNLLLEAKQQEIYQKNEDLERLLQDKDGLLEEKEWMMKEIHHRVKNNLQVITGLLYSQSTYLKDPAASEAIRESQNRVHAMALIHQKLYQTQYPSLVCMHDYVQEISEYLVKAFNLEANVKVDLKVDHVSLDVSLAVPLGLIINEILTNALKYAFPDGRLGTIVVTLTNLNDYTCLLTISDNGIGLPEDFNLNRNGSLGMNIIRGLSRQLKGNLKISHTSGVEVQLEFSSLKTVKPHVLST